MAKSSEVEKQKTLEVEKLALEVEQAKVAALAPKASAVKAPEGTTTVDDTDGMIGRLVGHELLADAARAIQNAIVSHSSDKRRILLVNDRDLLGADWPYTVVKGQIEAEAEAIQWAFEDLPCGRGAFEEIPVAERARFSNLNDLNSVHLFAPIGPVADAVIGTVSAAAGLAGMFKTDYGIHGGAVKFGGTPLLSAIAGHLLANDCEVTVDSFELLDAEIFTQFWATVQSRNELEACTAATAAILASLDDGGDGQGEKGAGPSPREVRLKRSLAAAEATIKRFDDFAKAVTASGEGGRPLLVSAAARERLHLEGEAAYTHVLFVDVEGGGQETITSRKLFGRSGKMRYLGGLQVSFLLHDVASNRTVAAGTKSLLGQIEYDIGKAEAGTLTRIPLT